MYKEEKEMRRNEVKRLIFNFELPRKKDGKTLQYHEVYIDPHGTHTWEDAKKTLRRVQEAKSKEAGWHCEGGICEGIFKENGKFYAYRYHGRYE
mgnify:CR=1 FL=1